MGEITNSNNQSLNSSLLTGPDLLQNLVAIILRFREHPIAISADIEGMFMQVGVPPSDQLFLRILWREESTGDVEAHQYTRHIFGATDSPTCSNYALQRTATDNENQYPNAAKAVHTSFYMDDLLKSLPTVHEAIKLSQDLVSLLSLGGFNLTKWQSSHPEVVNALKTDTTPPPSSETHVLGMKWMCSDDTLIVSRGTTQTIDSRTITQRLVLSTLSAVFDPIGLVAPFTITARLLLRSIWREKGQDWDAALGDELTKQFTNWASELQSLQHISIPRCYFAIHPPTIELHVFGDASLDAFAVVAYLCAVYDDGTRTVRFVVGKARVSPIKPLTIPKLELQAALTAARIKRQLCSELTFDIATVYMWSDSATVIQWIRSSHKRQPVFVANRVSEILEHTTVDQWHHVPGDQNPADHATRGLSASDLLDSTWIKGPTFLVDDTKWPKEFRPVEEQQIDINEVSSAATQTVPNYNWTKFNSFEKYTRIIAYARRFLSLNRKELRGTPLISDELEAAKYKLFAISQHESFSDEITRISKQQPLTDKSRISALTPFLDDNGILRSKSRISRLPTTFAIRHPIILDGKHPLVKYYIQQLHNTLHHEGIEYIRSVVQQHFWVLKLRSLLRTIKHNCTTCRKFAANCLQPQMADLPADRLASREFPFTFTGVDYFGPMYVTVRRSTQKRWCFLFTCMTTRAIHLELVHSMNTDSCILALQRFFARRGMPRVIRSDNGTNFVRSDKEIRQCFNNLNHVAIQQELAVKNIEWIFNPPAAPHHGGSWERLVRSCKRALYSILGSRNLTDEILSTALCLVEQSLNARPIVPVTSDIADVEALTPNHFLLGRPHAFVPLSLSPDLDARKAYLRAEQYANQIWSRWLAEYVPTLHPRQKWRSPDRDLSVGDLVWIVHDSSPRGHYPLARVTELERGADGVARAAILRTATATLKRPVTKLAPVFSVLETKNRAG